MTYDLCAIGNALVDIIAASPDAFLAENGIVKGSMQLIDDARAASLFDKAPSTVEMTSGGSAGNTVAGFASLGGKAAYIGKVGKDKFGEIFAHDLQAQNIHFAASPSADLPTGRCLIFVTPDAQRSMNTSLGAAAEFGEGDIDGEVIRNSAVTYLEGYLFDKDAAKQAFRRAAKIAHDAGKKLALTLSDTFCVARHRAAFLELVKNDVDILFANEGEIIALYGVSDIHGALEALRRDVEIGVVTQGASGATIVGRGETWECPAAKASQVIDTTGAGDLYAAGFLFGLARNKDLAECGRIGAIAAAEVISHYGPRPQKNLADLL